MKRLFQTTIAAALSIAMIGASCSSIDDLRTDLDDLTARVESLEGEVSTINESMTSLNALLADNVAIKSVNIEEDKITFVLSNGGEYTVYKYVSETYNIPSVSVDSDGYWIVSYDNFETYENILDSEGNKIYAGGSDGQTPTFSIDSDNYWMVAYGDGAAEYLLDASGNKVSALGVDGETGADGDAFFQDAVATDDCLTLTLSNGAVVEVPISNFSFEIITAVAGVQLFTYEDTQIFEVVQVDVASASISAPDRWVVELTETQLIVTAPAQTDTRATASNQSDIAITAVSASGLVAIAKIEVEAVATINTPAIDINESSVTSKSSSISFDLSTLTDATAWYYQVLPSSDTAPTAAELLANGTAVDTSTTSVSVSALSQNTEYVIYVIAYNSSVESTIDSYTISTPIATDPYSVDGYTVGDKTYYAADGTMLTESTTITEDGVYFLSATEDVEFTISASVTYNNLVIIGDSREYRSKIAFTGSINFGDGVSSSNGIILNNIEATQGALNTSTSAVFGATSTPTNIHDNLIVDNSIIHTCVDGGLTAVVNFNQTGSGVKSVKFNNSIFDITQASENAYVRGLYINNTGLTTIESFVINNSVLYTNYSSKMLVLDSTKVLAADFVVEVTNNTFINGVGNNSMFELGLIKSITFDKNIMWISADNTNNVASNIVRVKYVTVTDETYTTWITSLKADDSSFNMVSVDNVGWHNSTLNTVGFRAFHTSGDYYPKMTDATNTTNPTYNDGTVDPFEGGTFDIASFTFIPASDYTDYGASDLW